MDYVKIFVLKSGITYEQCVFFFRWKRFVFALKVIRISLLVSDLHCYLQLLDISGGVKE